MTAPIDFRILGPLEAYDGDRPVPLGGTRQRALLGMLLLHADEVVSSDRLIAEVWGEGPAEGPKALQVAVSRLRKALDSGRAGGEAGDLIVTRPPGYELQLESHELDLQRFETLVAEGREALTAGDPGQASAKLGEALRLWRGEPLADLAYEAFCQFEIARLGELRVAALEDRIAADLQLGRHVELVAELGELISRQPLRERLRGQLMLALYRSGRQAEALEAYADARRALVAELGIEPSRELEELQQAVLAQEPALDRLPLGLRAPPDSPRGAFVGRKRELAELNGALGDALAGHGRLVLLAGEPGIGKSQLADQLVGAARARGARVLIGRCWEAGGAPAYWPWVQALRVEVRETEPEVLRKQLGAGAADLAQILPELRGLFPELPEPPTAQSEGVRVRLFDAVSSFLQNAAQVQPLVLVLDDLHVADEPSLLMLRFLARDMADSRLLVVCAFRDVDPRLRDPLSSTLAELAREPQTAQIGLAGLSEADVADYIARSTGTAAAPGLVEAIHAETEGNPFFVAEVVRLLDVEDRMAEPDAHLRIPPEVRTVVGQRVGRLSERCRTLLVAASVMGREFGLDALGRLTELAHDELLDVLDEAIAERLLGDVPGSPDRLRFSHALIRDALYYELSSTRRLALHKDAAGALEAVYSADLEPHLAELARHYWVAFPAGGVGNAIDYARRAGDRAATQLAYEEAVRHYEMALTLAGEVLVRCDLLLALGEAQARAGDLRASKRAFREAAELAEANSLAEHLARAALGYGGRIIWDTSGDDEYLVPLLERALAALGGADSPLRVRLLARLAGGPLRAASFPAERKATLSHEALDMARRLGDGATVAYALSGYLLDHNSPEHTRGRLQLANELVDVATAVGDSERAIDGHENRFNSLLELGDMGGAKLELEAMARLADELAQPSQDWLVSTERALIALLEGRLAEAEALISESHTLGERPLPWSADVTYRVQLYPLRRAQGRLAEVEDLVRRSVAEQPIWRCVLAQIAAASGNVTESRGALEALAADGFAGLPFDEEWLVSLGFLAETASSLGEVRQAPVLYRLLHPYADRVAVSYTEISIGSVARYLGLLAAMMERWVDAERHFEEALEVNERIGARPWLAHTREDYAGMLLARGTPADRDKAHSLHAAALATYRELGMDTTPGRHAPPVR